MILGVDVSHWSGMVDWDKASMAGARFAYIKASEALWPADGQFARNWAASKGKLPRGAYHFFRYAADPIKQAGNFAAIVGTDKGELPPALDLEDTAAPHAAGDLPGKMLACAAEIERLFGRRPIIYTARWWWDAWVVSRACLATHDLWVANYTTAGAPLMPTGWSSWRLWQFSADHNGRGHEFGCQSDDVDISGFGGDDAQFAAWANTGPMPLTIAQKVELLWAAHPELHPV